MQTPNDLIQSVTGTLVWLIDMAIVFVRIGLEWSKQHLGFEFLVSIAKFVTDAIILGIGLVLEVGKWLAQVVGLIAKP
jgi:hypothetical protein